MNNQVTKSICRVSRGRKRARHDVSKTGPVWTLPGARGLGGGLWTGFNGAQLMARARARASRAWETKVRVIYNEPPLLCLNMFIDIEAYVSIKWTNRAIRAAVKHDAPGQVWPAVSYQSLRLRQVWANSVCGNGRYRS